MIRIEKTNLNCGALITISSTLRDLQSNTIIEVSEDGLNITLRPKMPHEKKDISIDLTFFDKIFNSFIFENKALSMTGDAEVYFRKCSFACNYFLNESGKMEPFDVFNVFHDIHFNNTNEEYIVLKQFCNLFRIQYSNCTNYIDSKKEDVAINLQEKRPPYNIFKRIEINDGNEIVFKSYDLEMVESLDALFSIKDLLFSKGIDTQKIAPYNQFSIGQDEEVKYAFDTKNYGQIQLNFSYRRIIFLLRKI